MSSHVAVIGAGVMRADHARTVPKCTGDPVLQFACDALDGQARSVADEYGALDVSTDPHAVIAQDDVHPILISSPDETHAPLRLAAMDMDKHVLSDKPSSRPDTCQQVVQAEVSRGARKVQIGSMRRFNPSYQAMREALNDDWAGRPLTMHNCPRSVRAPASFTGQISIANAGLHESDIGRSVLGTEFKAIIVFQPSSSDETTGAFVYMALETPPDNSPVLSLTRMHLRATTSVVTASETKEMYR